jgi:predicted PurR-regulated permease PerM
LLLFVPTISLIYFAAVEIAGTLQNWKPTQFLGTWQETLQGWPRLESAWNRISQNIDLATAIGQLAEQVRNWATAIVAGSVYSLVQALIALFVLFYLYRDEDRVLASVRELSPLTNHETDRLLKRLADTVYATIFGTVVVAMIQGTLGGIVFWLLGLPAPVLWGTVMVLLAMIPYLGAFVVWAPASAILGAQGDWGKAMALVAWGMIAIGLIDNLIYPILVGNRLRQHTVITFLAILGGLAVFGASGIVLGPVVVSLTFFLLEVWRNRTTGGRAAETS